MAQYEVSINDAVTLIGLKELEIATLKGALSQKDQVIQKLEGVIAELSGQEKGEMYEIVNVGEEDDNLTE